MNKLLLLLISIICITGCDCERDAKGVVVDFTTGTPLDNVTVKSYARKISEKNLEGEALTDTTGIFTGSTGLAGGHNDCVDLFLVFSRVGYKTKAIVNFEEGTVYMTRE